MIMRPVLCASIAVLFLGSAASAQETYRGAEVDPRGQLRITSSSGREILITKDKEQVGFDKIAISPDGRTVAWLALYENCCTSYPIPLKLLVYVNGKRREFRGSGLPIWLWAFSADSRRIAFHQETVHGGLGSHYELRDIISGRLASSYDPDPDKPISLPDWAQTLEASR
jgi:hypothetical protein